MSRRLQHDVLVIGGGVVGSACALALADAGLDVALVEAKPPPRWVPEPRDLRVFAFAHDSAALLQALGAWADIRDTRAHPYRRMQVWDAGGGDDLVFDADTLGRRELGWIIENNLLADRLWRRLDATGVAVHCPASLSRLEQTDAAVRLQLDDGQRLSARLLVAADGAASPVREQAGIGVDTHAYHQRGVVAYIRCEQPHRDTAWQRFLPGGPLAVLPCGEADGAADGSHLASIVWSLPDADAERLLASDDAAFNTALTRAFDARLGAMQLVSSRAAFPLRRQLAATQCSGRVLLVGDAAHVVHPLAGQGVNLGLRDVAALRDSVLQARQQRAAFDQPHRLQRWARRRRSENAVAAHAFDGINLLFSNDHPAAVLLRGPALAMAGRLPPLAAALWRRASGV